jgi:hypothetical protein
MAKTDMRTRILAAVAVALSLSGAAHAQLASLSHVWSVPGVMSTSSGLGTYIACSNGGALTQAIGVEVYGPAGALVADDSISVAPNATVLFGTVAALGLPVDVNLATGTVTKGHARIYGSSRGVLCSAFLADATAAIPASTVNLSVVKKTSQRGE